MCAGMEDFMIQDNITKVLENIEAACKRSHRSKEEVTLIAVSKTKPIELLKEAYEAGIREFGENKVQELCDKCEKSSFLTQLSNDCKDKEEKFFQNVNNQPESPILQVDNTFNDIHWHMIGHLQRNKVKYIVDKVKLIHSVDSLRLAEQIDIEAKKKGVLVDILIEINIALEESKFGVKPSEAEALIREISGLSSIGVKGLMTVAPYTENAEENRTYFKKMHQLYVDIKEKNIDNVTMNILSMGMTGDYEVAIEEGSTMVRVGTGIFGERNYSK